MAEQANKKLDKIGLSHVWAKIGENFVSKGILTDELIDKLVSMDTYTKEEINTAIMDAIGKSIAGVYKVKGSIAFENIPESGMKNGDVYNVTNDFTATDAFISNEAGKHFPAGTNIVYTENGWDAMAGTYDFSDFMMRSELENITVEEINEICVMTK